MHLCVRYRLTQNPVLPSRSWTKPLEEDLPNDVTLVLGPSFCVVCSDAKRSPICRSLELLHIY